MQKKSVVLLIIVLALILIAGSINNFLTGITGSIIVGEGDDGGINVDGNGGQPQTEPRPVRGCDEKDEVDKSPDGEGGCKLEPYCTFFQGQEICESLLFCPDDVCDSRGEQPPCPGQSCVWLADKTGKEGCGWYSAEAVCLPSQIQSCYLSGQNKETEQPGGTQKCTSQCNFGECESEPFCGNDKKEEGEYCDGTDVGICEEYQVCANCVCADAGEDKEPCKCTLTGEGCDKTKEGCVISDDLASCEKNNNKLGLCKPCPQQLLPHKECRVCVTGNNPGYKYSLKWKVANENKKCITEEGVSGKCINGKCSIDCDPPGKPGDTRCEREPSKSDWQNINSLLCKEGEWKKVDCQSICDKVFGAGGSWGCWDNTCYCKQTYRNQGPIKVQDIDKGVKAGSLTTEKSIYLIRQKDCYVADGFAYQIISDINKFNVPVYKEFYADKNCDITVNNSNIVYQRYEDSEILTNEVLKSCNIQYGQEETITISTGGGNYDALCSSGICHARLEVPLGAISEDTTLTIKELILNNCNCGNSICEVGESPETCSTDCKSCDDDEDCGIDCLDGKGVYRIGNCIGGICYNFQYLKNCSIRLQVFIGSPEEQIYINEFLQKIYYFENNYINLQEILRDINIWTRGYKIEKIS